MIMFWSCRKLGTYGFSTMWAAPSAAESVMVMVKSVAAKPSSTRMKILPHQFGRKLANMAMEPPPLKLSLATRRYTGSAPSSVSATSTSVASGDSTPAASAAIPG